MVHENLTWPDLQNIRFLNDNSPVLQTYRVQGNINESYYDLAKYLTEPEYDGWLRVSLQDSPNEKHLNAQFLRQVNQLEKFITLQQTRPDLTKGFIWEMNPTMYHYSGVLKEWKQKHIKADCKIIKPYPDLVYRLKEKFFEGLKRKHPYTNHFVYLHIRRGDTIDVCDTSLERMRDYLSCSFDQSKKYGNFTILMSSDEKNSTYRKAIQSMVEDGGHRGFVDLDSAVWKLVRNYAETEDGGDRLLNNMVVFKIVKSIHYDEQVALVLAKHRGTCPDCSSIYKTFGMGQVYKKRQDWIPEWIVTREET